MTCLWHMSCMFASSNPLPTGSTYTPTDPRFPVRSAKKFPGYTSSNLSESKPLALSTVAALTAFVT